MFCTVLLTSQVVMIQSLQPEGRAFESTCALSFFFTFIQFVFLVSLVAFRPKSTAMVIAGRSVHLTTPFPGQA